jgi:uncharacterized protein YqjF (DUF2071 family)
VAFVMAGTKTCPGPRWAALPPIPELNVRTYVRVQGVPGVWFLSLDASSPLFVLVGRTLYGLRYELARMAIAADRDRVHYLSTRSGAAFSATYEPTGPPRHASPGSLEHFLVERYRLFAERRGRLITAEVAHEPWPLQRAAARIELNRMAPPGLAFRGTPLLHFVRSVEARISGPERLGRPAAQAWGRAMTRPAAGSAIANVAPGSSTSSSRSSPPIRSTSWREM